MHCGFFSPSSRAGNGWWWVPMVAPMVGSATGVAVYELGVEFHHPPTPEEEEKEEETPGTEKGPPKGEKDIEIPVFSANMYTNAWTDSR